MTVSGILYDVSTQVYAHFQSLLPSIIYALTDNKSNTLLHHCQTLCTAAIHAPLSETQEALRVLHTSYYQTHCNATMEKDTPLLLTDTVPLHQKHFHVSPAVEPLIQDTLK